MSRSSTEEAGSSPIGSWRHARRERGRQPEATSPTTRLDLRPDERILWSGRPEGSLLDPLDVFWIPFGIFSVVVSGLVLAAFPPVSILPVVGSAVLLARGLWVLALRFGLKAIRRRTTLYTVTNHRAIELVGGARHSLPLAQLSTFEVTRLGSRGGIIFGAVGPRSAFANLYLDAFQTRRKSQPLAFYDILDPEEVAERIERAALSAGAGQPARDLRFRGRVRVADGLTEAWRSLSRHRRELPGSRTELPQAEARPKRMTAGPTLADMSGNLRPGERVLWMGEPHWPRLSALDIFWIPLGIFWLLFSTVFTFGLVAAALTGHLLVRPAPLYVAWGGLFVAIGLFLVAAPFWVRIRQKRGWLYAVTDRRVLEKCRGRVRSIPLRFLPSIDVLSRGDLGGIVFGPAGASEDRRRSLGAEPLAREIGAMPLTLYNIPDPERVARMIVEAAGSDAHHSIPSEGKLPGGGQTTK